MCERTFKLLGGGLVDVYWEMKDEIFEVIAAMCGSMARN